MDTTRLVGIGVQCLGCWPNLPSCFSSCLVIRWSQAPLGWGLG